MTEMQEAHAKGAARLTTPENADDAFSEVTEELTALRAIVEAASHSSGEEYFQAFVRNLARLLDAHCAFIAEFASAEVHTKARTIARRLTWPRECAVTSLVARSGVSPFGKSPLFMPSVQARQCAACTGPSRLYLPARTIRARDR
jgi:hypothetical protein